MLWEHLSVYRTLVCREGSGGLRALQRCWAMLSKPPHNLRPESRPAAPSPAPAVGQAFYRFLIMFFATLYSVCVKVNYVHLFDKYPQTPALSCCQLNVLTFNRCLKDSPSPKGLWRELQ